MSEERSRDLAGLAQAPPGPDLAALLAGLDLTAVPAPQLVEVLRASWREVSHAYAGYLAVMAELGRCAPASAGGRGIEWEWAESEIGAALTFTARRACGELDLARQLCARLPRVWRALHEGQIDVHKARVFADYLSELTDPQITRILDRLLPQASRLTTGQLAARLLREVQAVDPGYTRRRYERAARDRGVWGYLAIDGTAVLSAHGLSPAEAAAAAERLERLAESARAAGHPGTLNQLRADLFVRLLDGRYTGFDQRQIVAALLAEAAGGGDQDTTRGPEKDEASGSRTASRSTAAEAGRGTSGWATPRYPGSAGSGEPSGSSTAATGGDPGVGGAAEPVPDQADDAPPTPDAGRPDAAAAHEADGMGGLGSTGEVVELGGAGGGGRVDDCGGADRDGQPRGSDCGPGPAGTSSASSAPTQHPPRSTAPPPSPTRPATKPADPPLPGVCPPTGTGTMADPAASVATLPAEGVRYGVEVRVGLATLLGLDDHPAEIPGWGPIPAEDARLLVSRQHAAEWRYAVTDQRGYLRNGGLTRRRPRDGGHHPACLGGIVEIHVRAGLLAELARCPDLPQEWAAVIEDLHDQVTRSLHSTLGLDDCPRSRRAGAGLRRHIQMRDRTCVAPGCRRPARASDLDHTVEYQSGGPTTRANLEPLCERHHAMKHRGGWQLDQPHPGYFRWRSPLGHIYWTRGEPIAPDLPEPLDRSPEDDPDDGWDDGPDDRPDLPIFRPPRAAPRRPPPPRPTEEPADDPPF